MNYASALILNKMVLALQKTRSTVDLALSSREYALANNSEERDLQLLYGFSALKSIAYNSYDDTLSFGKSLLKSITSNTNLSFPTGDQMHHRISDMRDDLRNDIDTKHEKIIDKLDLQTKASTEQHKAIADKISSIEKWRYMMVGGSIVMGYILAHIKLDKLI